MRFTSFASVAISALSLSSWTSAAPLKARQLSETDILVMKFAQVLEQLETEFYKQALATFTDDQFIAAGFSVPAVPKQIFTSILEHEGAHTEFLSSALQQVNDAPLDTCTFDFTEVLKDVQTMAAVARVIEQVGVGAYIGGGVLLEDPNILSAAASILTIESRHQTALNILNGASGIPQAFDQALSPEQVLALAGPFIKGCDLGIPANLPVTLTSVPTPGEALQFDLTGIEGDALFCQMILAGHPTALSQPIENCVVPEHIPDGPVYIFITDDYHPLLSNIVVQNGAQIKAGPAIAFFDITVDALGDLVRGADTALDLVGGNTPPVTDENGSNTDVRVIGTTTRPA